MRRTWRVVNLTHHDNIRNLRYLIEVTKSLLSGEIFGDFVETMICDASLSAPTYSSLGSAYDREAWTRIIKDRPMIRNNVVEEKFLDLLGQGDEYALFSPALSFLANLR